MKILFWMHLNLWEAEVVKSYREELWFDIPTRRAFVNITPQIEACLEKSEIREGLMLVNTRKN